MNIEQVREYTLSLPGVTEDQAFGEDILNCPVREILLPSWKKFAAQLGSNSWAARVHGFYNRG